MLSDTNQDHRGDAQSAPRCECPFMPELSCVLTEGVGKWEGGGDPHVNSFPLNEYVMETDEANDS